MILLLKDAPSLPRIVVRSFWREGLTAAGPLSTIGEWNSSPGSLEAKLKVARVISLGLLLWAGHGSSVNLLQKSKRALEEEEAVAIIAETASVNVCALFILREGH